MTQSRFGAVDCALIPIYRVRPLRRPATVTRQPPSGPDLRLAITRSAHGGSGSFLAEANDGHRYWCKAVNNPQGPKVPATEQIVARLGTLASIAVCPVQLLRVPPAIAGWEFRDGIPLAEGWVHGSLAIHPVTETHTLAYRQDDDNAKRHAGYFALYDWLFGNDPQWLVSQPAGWMYYSHDHGHYFPGGPAWTVASLEGNKDTPNALGADIAGLDRSEVLRIADALDGIDQQMLEDAVADLPFDWPVSDAELDAVVAFAMYRRTPVASRLRTLLPGGSP